MRLIAMRTVLALSGLFAATGVAVAADPVGEWLVKDGSVRIKVVSCPQGPGQAPALWGVISAEAEPGYDTASRDPAMRGRPLLGIPILINMRPAGPNLWNGKIYDPQGNALVSGGGIYSAKITLNSKDMLEVRGCFGGLICDGEDWKRITDPNTPPLPPAPVAQPVKGAAKAKNVAAAPSSAATPAADPICSNVSSLVPGNS